MPDRHDTSGNRLKDDRDLNDASTSRPSAARRTHHWTMLVGSIFVMMLAGFLSNPDGRQVQLSGWPLPSTCGSKTLFGVDCPGCGLTRSFVSLAHGDWAGAWRAHRLGWLLALLVVIQIPYRAAALMLPDRELLGYWPPKIVGYVVIGLLLGNWLIEQLSRWTA
jgi:hypothetical protein